MSIFENNKPTIKEWARRIEAGESVDDLKLKRAPGTLLHTGIRNQPEWVTELYIFPPKTITVNDVECEANFIPEKGEHYHLLYGAGFVCYKNDDSPVDIAVLSIQPVFRSYEAAKAYNKAAHKPFMLGGESEN